jgi:hypothetical protein
MLAGGSQCMKFIINLSLNEDFVLCTQNLTEEAKQQRFDQELVLRFFAFKNWRAKYTHDVADFLTDYMEAIADPIAQVDFDYVREKEIFERTFKILAVTLEDRAFGWTNKSGNIVRGFAVYHFEAFTLGLQPFLDDADLEDDVYRTLLKDILEGIKRDPEFISITSGGGRNSKGALDRRVEFVEQRLAAEFR